MVGRGCWSGVQWYILHTLRPDGCGRDILYNVRNKKDRFIYLRSNPSIVTYPSTTMVEGGC
jgi:hypothetical protein